ncbi:hypothetical protein F53441_5970 [Fusarium austroafricanum]|uniref:Uncharacterized protein n=1 Tax=Fusarium austroafricanum TaxID=2364996 RepID=A0A8H4KJU0_9HYPO|nr:hypothetical protein F53441_5970 [Fusarium austroafricanum]
MIISNSLLFKEYAQAALDPKPSRVRASYSPLSIVDTVIQHLVDLAKLEITRFKISKSTEDSFNLAIEGRLIGIGTLCRGTIHAAEGSLSFNGSSFGKVKLPPIQTSFWGTNFVVQEQRIDITNRAIYHAFIRSVIVDDNTSLQLKSKECIVKVPGTSSICDLHLEMSLEAIGGPKVALKKLSRSAENVTIIFSLGCSGPVEIDYGCCVFEFRNGHSESLAELRGELNIAHGRTELTLHGITRDGVVPSNRVRLVGIGVEGNEKSWLHDTIKEIDVVVDLEPKCVEILWC